MMYNIDMARKKGKAKDAPIKIKKPTLKQKAFVRELIDNKFNGTEAASRTYNVKNRNTANAIASENLAKPVIQKELHDLMEKQGLTKSFVLENMREAIKSGVGRDSRNSDALRGLDMVAKIYGMYPSQKKTIEKREISVHLHGKSDTEIADMLNSARDAFVTVDD